MAESNTPERGPEGSRINVSHDDELKDWSRKLDASREQIKEAVQAVGDRASDVEEHLKGSRSTTNSERTKEALGDAPSGETAAGKREG